MLYLYPQISPLKVIPAVYLVPGLAVWRSVGPPCISVPVDWLWTGHLYPGCRSDSTGQSGDQRRDAGVFPVRHTGLGRAARRGRVSWETHLFAGLVGLVLGPCFRRLDVPPRKRYAWEEEDATKVPVP
ncbi:MAG: hypothetical protein Ct9H300mP16_13030 [Pseudomonadota bacterium]|nr:MAG: hypothetical protein Ct9H300mP16_13030 [Pseudomonadota bacterium]